MLKNYWKPTPKKWRKLGDALLIVSTSAIPLQLSGYNSVAIALFIIGIAGKFITNLFK